jgi:uncharacterized RDD family membrane protein YckC
MDRHGYAGFWLRVGAGLVDSVVLLIPTMSITYLLGATTPTGIQDPLDVLYNILVWWVYTAALMASPWQATLGMKACALRIVDYNGGRISFARATGRYFAEFLACPTLGVAFFMIAWTSRRQALHDIIAETLVIKQATYAAFVAPPLG